MTLHFDVVSILDWIARLALGASFARIGLHYLKGGLQIWIEPGASFWGFYEKVESTIAWLSVSLQKFGSKRAVAAESIKELLEEPEVRQVDVEVTTRSAESQLKP